MLILFAYVSDTDSFVGRLNFSPANDHIKPYCAKVTSKKNKLSRVGGRGRFRGRARQAPPGADEATARPEQWSKSRDASAERAISGTVIRARGFERGRLSTSCETSSRPRATLFFSAGFFSLEKKRVQSRRTANHTFRLASGVYVLQVVREEKIK